MIKWQGFTSTAHTKDVDGDEDNFNMIRLIWHIALVRLW